MTYELAVTYFGYLLFLVMSLRLPVAWADSRIFLRCVRTSGYSRPLWFAFQRSFMPSILGAPLILWMTPGDFLRRTPAPVIWDMAGQMLDAFGEEDTAVETHKPSDDCN